MAQLHELDDDQMIVYGNMLVTKGNALRREIMRKRDRLKEIDNSLLPQEAKDQIVAAIIPGFDQVIATIRDEEITADLVVLATTPE